jgi:hypothetical protein
VKNTKAAELPFFMQKILLCEACRIRLITGRAQNIGEQLGHFSFTINDKRRTAMLLIEQ